uniref:Uncharacterized protein n=1 Tax=Mesocestoides corti TaxID=53468 RepID=A0A5K3EW54_MESCO
MPLEHRETQDQLRPGGPICLRPDPTSHHTTLHFNYSMPSVLMFNSTKDGEK